MTKSDQSIVPGFYLEFSDRGCNGRPVEVWGTKVPQRGPGQSPGGDLGAKPPEAVGNV